MAAGKEVKNLKSKLDGDQLDLSLSDLSVVPVREITALKKVTDLDLSRNHIVTLPDDFATLRNLTRLDLSANKLRSLPENFGKLENLQQLDLFKNNLETLPVSFCNLKQLRWLDVKDNPLEPSLQKVAGDCLDAKQCKEAATKVVQYMQKINADRERERQKELKKQKDLEAIEKSKEVAEAIVKSNERKKEKERRKEAKQTQDVDKRNEDAWESKKNVDGGRSARQERGSTKDEKSRKNKKGRGILGCIGCIVSIVFGLLFLFVVLVLGLAALLYVNCSQPTGKEIIPKSRELCQDLYQVLQTGRLAPLSWNYKASLHETTRNVRASTNAFVESLRQFDYVGWKNTIIETSLVCRDTAADLLKWTYENGSEIAKPALRKLAEWFWMAVAVSLWLLERALYYVVLLGQWTIETTSNVVNNFPEYWEKVKYYWKNMK